MEENQKSLVTLDLLGRSSHLRCEDNVRQPPSLQNARFPPVAMSLRTRERSSNALKRIFEQIHSRSGNVRSVAGQLGFVPTKASLVEGKMCAGMRRSVVGHADTAQGTSFAGFSSDELRDSDMLLQEPEGMDNLHCQMQEDKEFLSLKSFAHATADQHRRARSSVSIDDAKRSSRYPDDMDTPKPPAVPVCTESSIDNVQVQKHLQTTALGSQLSHPSFRDSYQRFPLMPAQQLMHTSFPRQQVNQVPQPTCAFSRPGDMVRQSTAQLTIFYAGNVNVYEDMPTETAHAIMLLARSANSLSSDSPLISEPSVSRNSGIASSEPTHAVFTALRATMETATKTPVSNSKSTTVPILTLRSSTSLSAPVLPTTSVAMEIRKKAHGQSHADLPFARKASLVRFLEKRRNRAQGNASTNETKKAYNSMYAADTLLSEESRCPKKCCIRPPSSLLTSTCW